LLYPAIIVICVRSGYRHGGLL